MGCFKIGAFVFFILLFGVKCPCYAQPFYFKHYQVEEGLSNNTVFAITQDEQGFMWFGTKEGLNRFDGTSFKAFNDVRYPEDMKGFILCLSKGIDGILWVGTRKGVYEFNEKNETFTSLKLPFTSEIYEIKSDNKGKIWFVSNQKLYCYLEKTHSLRLYDLGSNSKTAAICITPDGSLYGSSPDGYLFKYDASSDTFRCINETLPAAQARLKDINRLFYSSSGKLFIGTTDGLTLFDPQSKTYKKVLKRNFQGKSIYVRDIIQPSEEELWIASESGIHIYNTKTEEVFNLHRHPADPYSISDNAVYSLYKDHEGGIWAATYFGGVNYFHKQQSSFKKYYPNSYENNISGNGVREICEDHNGNLWIGTEDAGLNKLDKQTGKVTAFLPGNSKTSISSTNIHGLLVDANELWIGTFQQGIDILDIKTGKVIRHYGTDSPGNGLKTNFIITFCKTKTNDIFAATNRGVYRYNRIKKIFVLVEEVPADCYAFSLFEDDKGTMWVGTIGQGIYYFNTKTEQKGNFRYDPNDRNGLGSDMICDIFQDSNKNYWFATEGGGLSKLDSNRHKFTRFDTDTGLPSNLVLKVLEDKNNNLWISTSKGLVSYNPGKGDWKTYTKGNGLLTDQFNYNSAYSDASGRLYFGSVKGLISFDPASIWPNAIASPVYITSFQVNNKELPISGSPLAKSITFTDTISLKYDQSSFSIGFSASTYMAPETTPYAYKLEGIDKDWSYLNNNRRVYYTDLSPGIYTFKIKSAGSNGVWDNKVTQLVIKIAAPFWLSVYAYIIYCALAFYLIYAGVSRYHKKTKEESIRKLEHFEQEKEKEIYHAKIEFFTNVAHEIRTPLTLIKGPLETVIDLIGDMPHVKKNLKSIEKNTERLIALTTQLLDFRKTETKSFSLSYVKTNIPKLLKEICSSFTAVAEHKSLVFKVHVPEKSFHAYIDNEAFKKIMSNVLTNAIKYGDRKVIVSLAEPGVKGKTFNIEVGNDGPLIPESLREKVFQTFFRISSSAKQPGSGIGLPLARSLAELHGGTLEMKKERSEMNVFVLKLPVHQSIEFKLTEKKD